MKQFRVTIRGTKIGTIWMPAVEATKEFEETFTPEDAPFTRQFSSLRDSILSILNDGDFQSCSILEAHIEVTRWHDNKRISTFKELSPCMVLSDCFA